MMWRVLVLLLLLPALAWAGSLQQALDNASPGSTVTVPAGVQTEQLVLRTPRVTLTGEPGAILDGSQSTSGWTQTGDGAWQATLGNAAALTADGHGVWRINGNSDSWTLLRAPADGTTDTAQGPCNVWDGIEALFSTDGGTTTMRFRDGSSPAQHAVRAASSGAVVTIQADGVTVQGLTIQGGEVGIQVEGYAQGTRILGNTLTDGRNRIVVTDEASGTVIQGNTMTAHAIGMRQFTPGDRNDTPYPRVVNRHMYDVNKFLIGDTETQDASIRLQGQATDTTIRCNDIGAGMMGIVFYGTTQGNTVSGNTFHHFSDIGIYINADSLGKTEVTGNTFMDMDHGLRLESGHRSMDLHIANNTFWQPCYGGTTGGGKDVFIAPPKGGDGSPAHVLIEQNTFTGCGWAVDMGGVGEFDFSYPNLIVRDNTINTNGISSGGTGPMGTVDGNQVGSPGGPAPSLTQAERACPAPPTLADTAPSGPSRTETPTGKGPVPTHLLLLLRP